MAKLATATVFISGNLEGLNRALGDAERSVKRSSGNILALGRSIGVGLTAVGAGITGFMATAVKEAANAEEVQAQLNAVLKSTGEVAGVTAKQVNDYADKMSLLTKFDDEAIVSAQSLLLTFTKIGKEVFPEASTAVLDMSQALGQDLKSSAIQLGKALNDPIKGITALRRVGIAFTKEQMDQIKVLVQNGETMKAQKIILAELATEMGGSAVAAGKTLAGQWEILKTQGGNLLEMIGGTLIPVLQNLFAQVKPHIEAAMQWAAANKELAGQLTLVAAGLGAFSLGAGPLLFTIPSLVGMVAKLIGVGGAILGGGLAGFVGLGVAVGALVGGAGLLVHFSDTVHTLINDRLPRLATLLDTVGGTLADIWGWLNKFPAVLQSIIPGLGLVISGLKWLTANTGSAASGLNPLLSNGPRGLAGSAAASSSPSGTFGTRGAGRNTNLNVNINTQGVVNEAMALRVGEMIRRKIEDRRA